MNSVVTQSCSVDTDAGRLFVRRWDLNTPASNNKAAIVLFHDSLGCVELWRDFPGQLAASTGRSVIAYDRLGFGKSDPNSCKLGSGFVTDEATTGFRFLRDALDLRAFVAFGHSVGGGMAAACAGAYPDSCRALITESAQTFVEALTVAGITDAKRAFAEPGQIERLQKYHGDKAAWVLSAWTDTWLSDDFARWDLEPELLRVRCPTLAIHGDRDEFGSVVHPARIADKTGGRSVVVEGCGHVPHREKAELVLDLVSAWLLKIG